MIDFNNNNKTMISVEDNSRRQYEGSHSDNTGKKSVQPHNQRTRKFCSLSVLRYRQHHRNHRNHVSIFSLLVVISLFHQICITHQANSISRYSRKSSNSDPLKSEVSRYGEIPERYKPGSALAQVGHELKAASSNKPDLKRVAKSILDPNKEIKKLTQRHNHHFSSTGGRRSGFGGSGIKFGSSSESSISKLLPNGPPPYIPPTLFLPHATIAKALDVLKRTKAFKSMYKSKVYYLFLDVLRQLTLLADGIAKKKIIITKANLALIQSVVNKFALKGGQALKLKWPLVLLNPHFLKGVLADPTFLVTLFHSLEIAYMATPLKAFWLKPLLKMVKQPSFEKEEQTWWRRKSFYDTLNGHGSSELQPNLKAIHFRNPGSPPVVAFPQLVHLIRTVANRQPPNPTHHVAVDEPYLATQNEYPIQQQQEHVQLNDITYGATDSLAFNGEHEDQSKGNNHNDYYMTTAQEEAFLNNQLDHNSKANQQTLKDSSPVASTQYEVAQQQESSASEIGSIGGGGGGQLTQVHEPGEYAADSVLPMPSQDDWLVQSPRPDQLMSQDEFNSLDARDKELILSEARKRFEESRLTNELIKQQDDLIESFANRKDDIFTVATDVPIQQNRIDHLGKQKLRQSYMIRDGLDRRRQARRLG